MLGYEGTANEVVKRLQLLLPDHPEILELDDPWGLFKIEGFDVKDLQPSLHQAA